MADNQLLLLGASPSIEGLRWQTEHRLRIGRQAKAEIVIDDPSLAQQHAEIRVTHGGWVVQDLGSATGTFLNGVPLGKLTRKLQQEDVLQCGRLVFKVSHLEWKPPPACRPPSQNIRTSGIVVRVQALSQLSWEQGLRAVALEDARLPHAKRFLTLLRAGYHLSRIDSLGELLQFLLDDTVAVLDAQRGAIVLADDATGQLTLRTVSGAQSENGGRAFSNTLARRCFSNGESLLCLDHEADLPQGGGTTRGDMASIICALLRSPRRRLGVLHLDRGPRQAPFSPEDFKLADAIAATVSVGIESAAGVEKQRAQFLQEATALAQQVMALRDAATWQHCQRVCTIALLLAEELGLSAPEKHELQLGAVLHDVGKLGVADGLSDSQKEKQLRLHPLQGVAIAETISGFAPALPIIRSHHERWDGTGYPDGLKGEQVPRLARVVALADALDNLLVGRPLQAGSPTEEVRRFFQGAAGRGFDPEIVDALLRLGPRLEELRSQEKRASERP